MTAVLSSVLLMAAVFIPLVGIAVAATPPNNCPTFPGDSETSVSTCYLDIAAPSSVRTDVAFTVQVRVTTDETNATVANTDPCGSKAPITLDLVGEYSDTQTVNASAGIATFSFTIPFGSSGEYVLFANGPGGGDISAAATADCDNTSFVGDSATLMAVDIPADAPIAPCPPDTNCAQATSGSGTQATLIADQFTSSWTDVDFQETIPGGDCAGDPRLDPNGVLRFLLTGTTDNKVIIFALDNSQVMKGIGMFNVCWSQPTPFMSNTGQMVTTGNLPTCKGKDQVAPCVASRVSGQHNVAFLTVLADADDASDPFGYGH
jgi:hypothetical protein